MVELRVTRKPLILIGAGALVLLLIAAFVLTRLSKPAEGRLKHDDTLQTTRVDKVWRVEKPNVRRCLEIRFKGDITGNARPTWGLTGPVTVWEHMRVHNAVISVEAQELGTGGECGDPTIMQGVELELGRETEELGWKPMPHLGVSFGKGKSGTSASEGFVGRLDGRTYDRGDSYKTTLGVYVEPTWTKHDNSSGDGATAMDTFELPITDG